MSILTVFLFICLTIFIAGMILPIRWKTILYVGLSITIKFIYVIILLIVIFVLYRTLI